MAHTTRVSHSNLEDTDQAIRARFSETNNIQNCVSYTCNPSRMRSERAGSFFYVRNSVWKTDIRVQTPNWHTSPTPRRMSSVDFRTGSLKLSWLVRYSGFRIGSLELLRSQLVINNPDYVLNQKDGMSCTTTIFHFYQSVAALCCDYSQSPKHTLGTCKWFLRNKH